MPGDRVELYCRRLLVSHPLRLQSVGSFVEHGRVIFLVLNLRVYALIFYYQPTFLWPCGFYRCKIKLPRVYAKLSPIHIQENIYLCPTLLVAHTIKIKTHHVAHEDLFVVAPQGLAPNQIQAAVRYPSARNQYHPLRWVRKHSRALNHLHHWF